MAMIKCKMCGGDLVLNPGQSVAECEYCGSRQTVPAADNEKKLTLFARANRLRAACEFDKAAGVYETIVADFSQEAEAYWGLTLCKYGIEYVDDPATGKKIPTCHRSSFDSVMDDGNLELALENADAPARRVYREEAKQIEELRKGIIAVSSNEAPYDIFICYKETDENGDRTLDSVLAQDIYDALRDRGYRVFFSRITLEDKLGQEYEPYIFAALNSAKIMLAVGTDYEYFNAVWVKNEWSRFLKLMERDKSKHLIPCFKGIDAYDMPKEFARLQAQDLGKVGAIQDLLRGIEKLMPQQKSNTVVVQEKVVVGGSGSNKIASLLDRGNMALEDGDWAKADSFFEDVLNNDSKNAQAYLGKTLAQERCRTIDAFVRKRKEASQAVTPQTLFLKTDDDHIRQASERWAIPDYVEPDNIAKLYQYDLSYSSCVAPRKEQYRAEERYWENHKLLSRAEKFAAGAVAENLQREKKALLAALSQRVKQAETAEAAAKGELSRAYAAHLAWVDGQVEKMHRDNWNRREQYYQALLHTAKTSSNIAELIGTAAKFDMLAYQDSKKLAEHCRKRAREEQDKLEAEKERQRVLYEKKRKAQRARNIKIAIALSIVAVLILAAVLVVTQYVIPDGKYRDAETILAAGDREGAIYAFAAVGDYSDAGQRRTELEMEVINRANVGDSVLFGVYKGEPIRWQVIDAEDDCLLLISTYGLDLVEFSDGGSTWEASNLRKWLNGTFKNQAFCQEEYANIPEKGADPIYVLSSWDVGHYFPNKESRIAEYTDYCASRMSSAGSMKDDRWWWAGNYASESKYGDLGYVNYVNTEGEMGECVSDHSYVAVRPVIWVRKDSEAVLKNNQERYAEAEKWAEGGLTLKAAKAFCALGDYQDAWSRGMALWGQMGIWETVSAAGDHTAAVKTDGTVVTTGYEGYGQSRVEGWTDIVAISMGDHHLVGLKADGTVVATGNLGDENSDLRNWTDIVAITAGYGYVAGLKYDGTVVALGKSAYGRPNVSQWTDIVAISAGYDHTVGLKSDGTVVAVGGNGFGQCNVEDWTDIVAISAGREYTVGLKANGTVVAVGNNSHLQCELDGARDVVAICAGDEHTVGLLADGTVGAAGHTNCGQCDVLEWTDIVTIAVGKDYTVGLKADGSLVFVGGNDYGEGDVGGWTDIRIPTTARKGE